MAVFTYSGYPHTVVMLPGGNKMVFSKITIGSVGETLTPVTIDPLEKVITWTMAIETSTAAVVFQTSGISTSSLNTVYVDPSAAANKGVIKFISFGR